MKFNQVSLGLLCLPATLAFNGSPPHFRRQADANPTDAANNGTDEVVPKHFIVEFAEDVDVDAAAKKIASDQGGKLLKVFDSNVFRGCAVEADADNLETLGALEPVVQAWQSRKLFLGEPSVQRLGGDLVLQNYSNHHMTGVDKLHAQGILGKGAKVGVIDTGINYGHAALGGGLGDGFKVAGGYDFVGDGAWPMDGHEKAPDSDPDDQQGHGTHVAGIVAGQSEFFTGVAPEATLYAYKVFGQFDGTDEETILEAMLQAYQDGVDIITISIGGVNGWSFGPWATVASRMVEQGVLVAVSAGNDGNGGAFVASSGSSGANVVAVASVEPEVIAIPTFKSTTYAEDGTSSDKWIPYRAVQDWYPTEVKDWPIWPVSLEPLDDEACGPLPEDTPDLSGKVVLVRRGGCNFSDKQLNLDPFNATHIIVYTNDQPITGPSTWFPASLLSMIPAEDGKAIIDTIAAGGNVTVDFDHRPDLHTVAIENLDLPGRASPFTSVGPTNDLFIKSDVAAPGGQILSTYLGDGFAIFSGTSMSCPYIAGVAALYVSKHGGRDTRGSGWAKNLAMRLISSGEAVVWDDAQLVGNTYDAFASVAQVGTGLVNATKVLEYETTLSLAKFALNDTHHFSRYHKVDITNGGDSPVTYTFSQQAFGGFAAINRDPEAWGTPRMAWLEELLVAPLEISPRISFPRAGFTVAPGETRTAQFNFQQPEAADDPAGIPVYSGKVLIHGSNGEELGVPYLGVAANVKKDLPRVVEPIVGYPSIRSTPDDIGIDEKANFTFDLSTEAQDYPRVLFRTAFATRQVRWDIFEASWRERQWVYPPVVGQAGHVGSVTSYARAARGSFDPEVDDADDVVALPFADVPRSIAGRRGLDLWWFGGLANGTQIAPGKYNMRLAALKPFGDPAVANNWDVVETPLIEVLPLRK